jgi:hypothetical protein
MKAPEITQDRGWSFATVQSTRDGFVGWAKFGPIKGTNPVNEPGEHVWFDHGDTRAEVIQKLKEELGLA